MALIFLSKMNDFLAPRLDEKAFDFVRNAQAEISNSAEDSRFSILVSLASRHIPRKPLALSASELQEAQQLLAGWSPQGWSLLETVRVSFVLARKDLEDTNFPTVFNGWFTHADEGETCAYYRSLPLLPNPKRFAWRAAEGCRTNMRTVFMAVACDSPYPLHYFDDVAWNQMIVKALFTETPLSQVYGLDQRLSSELTTMVLDYMDERSSAGRSIPIDAWLCLGPCDSERLENTLIARIKSGSLITRVAAIMALSRATLFTALNHLQIENTEARLNPIFDQALSGTIDQHRFQTTIAALASE